MRVPRVALRWLALATALLVGVPLLALTAASSSGAPPQPPGLQTLPQWTPTLVNTSSDPAHRFGESHVAVNPTNPNNLVVVYNHDKYTLSCAAASLNLSDHNCDIVPGHIAGIPLVFPEPKADFGAAFPDLATPKWFTCGVFTSSDRGATWTHVADFPGWPADHPEALDQGDCAVAAGPDGSFYLSFDDLNWNTPSVALPTCGIGVDKSTDGGTTWTGTTLSGTACDGPKIVADLSDGRIYEASSGSLGSRSTLTPSDPLVFPDSPNDRYVSSTTDGATWTTPHGMGGLDTSVSPAAYRSGGGGQMSAANGTIAVAFRSTSTFACSFFVGTSSPCLVFQSSTDAGATWTRHAVTNAAATILSAVMTAADPSTPGHYTVGGLNSSNQFVTYQTSDSGATWSTAGAALSDTAAYTKFHPWMGYSPSGTLGLTWSANQASGAMGTQQYKVYAAFSDDGAPRGYTAAPSRSATAPRRRGEPARPRPTTRMATRPDPRAPSAPSRTTTRTSRCVTTSPSSPGPTGGATTTVVRPATGRATSAKSDS